MASFCIKYATEPRKLIKTVYSPTGVSLMLRWLVDDIVTQ